MSRTTDPSTTAYPFSTGAPVKPPVDASVPAIDERGTKATLHDSLASKHVCPFCGAQNAVIVNASGTPQVGPCPRCTMEDTAATRQATKARIGPWHVLQTRNPAAPGMRYATLLALVAKGQVTARSVIRGPTTHQLWRYAAHVKGLSREFGVCYSCGEAVIKTAPTCSRCERPQEPSGNPDTLLEIREPTAPPPAPNGHEANGRGDDAIHDAYVVVAPTRPGPALPPPVSHAERIRAGRRPDGRVLSAMELAAALQVQPSPGSMRPTHRLRNVVLTVFFVVVGGLAVLGVVRPDLRNRALAWFHANWDPMLDKINHFHLQKPPPAHADLPLPPPPAFDPTPLPPVVPPAVVNTTVITPPAPMPEEVRTPPTIEISPATPPVEPSRGSSDLQQPEHPVLVGPAPTAKDLWALRTKGMDAESRQDYAEAIRCYEQIMLAPKELWPVDVKIRLSNAKASAAAKH